MRRIYVALDIETTGFDPQREAIIEIGAVKFRGQEVLDTWSSLVNPHRPIPYHIQRLTGISQEEAEAASSLFSLLEPLSRFVGRSPLVGHNIAFDLSFLHKHGILLTSPALDTFQLASILILYIPSYGLGGLAQTLGLPHREAHRALADAQTTREVFLNLWQRALDLDLHTVQEINRLAQGSDWPLRHFFLDVEEERGRTGGTSIRERLKAGGGGLLSPFLAPIEGAERLEPRYHGKPLDIGALSAILEEGGLLARYLPQYEYRPQQVEMLQAVASAFNEGRHLLVEAGTGVGKSLAYLLPAVHSAAENGRRVVVSTNTINLQDQLFKKDIPDLQEMLPLEFKVALLKGRNNYLCLRKFSYLKRRPGLTPPEVSLLAKILTWLPVTLTGDRTELNLTPEEEEIWGRLSAQEPCEPQRCPHLEGCYFFRVRRRAESAHIIVVNHALLLSDMVADNRVLPEYRDLIIDEAHHLEDRATEQLSVDIDQRWIYSLLERIYSPERGYGLLNRLPTYLRERGVPAAFLSEVEGYLKTTRSHILEGQGGLQAFLSTLANFLSHRSSGSNGYDERMRLTSGLRAQPDWAEVEKAWDSLSQTLTQVGEGLRVLHQGILGLKEDDALLLELAEREREIDTLRQEMEGMIAQPSRERVYWVNVSREEGRLSFHAAPLHVGALLSENLFSPLETLILTSATLRIAKDFNYLRERLGLTDAHELALGSPFDYQSSTLLFLPTDIPEPNMPGYTKAVEEVFLNLVSATEGRTLALFTSWAQLRELHTSLAGPLGERGVHLLAQGLDGSRHQILESFKNYPRSVLLGTRSFWEGIDVVGEALSCLVIARLPFPVPDDPIVAARSEGYEDPFAQYHLPQAVLRFRQGFGRLIRSKNDRGVVALLDKRVLTKYYGSVFIDSLPDCTVQQGSVRELPQAAAEWIKGGERR